MMERRTFFRKDSKKHKQMMVNKLTPRITTLPSFGGMVLTSQAKIERLTTPAKKKCNRKVEAIYFA